MESQYKPGFDGTQTPDARASQVRAANNRAAQTTEFLLRVLAIVTTLIAAAIMGSAKETQLVEFNTGLQTLFVSATAKSRYSSAFVFFVAANAIACVYSAFSLAASVMNSSAGTKGLAMFLSILDLLVVALLFSGIGAAGAIGIVGAEGNSKVGWVKICDVYGKFCRNVLASIIMSFIGSLVFILLNVFSTLNLHKRSS